MHKLSIVVGGKFTLSCVAFDKSSTHSRCGDTRRGEGGVENQGKEYNQDEGSNCTDPRKRRRRRKGVNVI
jgi:hypothetical protein